MTCVDIEKWLLEFETVEEKDDPKWSLYFAPTYDTVHSSLWN